jgi:integrase
LAMLQAEQAEGYPYVFVPAKRYQHIQKLQKQGKWTVEKGRCPVNNFKKMFDSARNMAGIQKGTFHDLRRTCLSNWVYAGMSEFDVMNLAGHAKFETTRKFYLAVDNKLITKARAALDDTPMSSFGTHLSHTPILGG